jgi:hypothetical protein
MALALFAVGRWAFLRPVVEWVVFQLLPTVTHIASKVVFTTVGRVVIDKALRLPVGARLHLND